jgi:DedD protein
MISMHQRLKERLVGAAVLVIIAVVFIPMLLTGPIDSDSITETNIPERPTEKFNSKLIPLNDSLNPIIDDEESISETTNKNEINDEVESEASKESTSAPEVEVNAKDEKLVVEKDAADQQKIISDKQVGLTAWVVQLGSFSAKVNADKLNLSLRKAGFPAFVEPLTKEGKTSYRVRVGPEILRADADALLKKIKAKMKLDGIVLSYP